MIDERRPSSILKSGNIKKRSKIFFTKKRMLYFTTDLKLIFIKMDNTFDEELYLDKSVKVKLKQSKKFVIKNPYFYKTIECDDAKEWVEIINMKLHYKIPSYKLKATTKRPAQ